MQSYQKDQELVTYDRSAARPTDTIERIREDAKKSFEDYWDCNSSLCDECPSRIDGARPYARYGASHCDSAMCCDLLRRIGQLAKDVDDNVSFDFAKNVADVFGELGY